MFLRRFVGRGVGGIRGEGSSMTGMRDEGEVSD